MFWNWPRPVPRNSSIWIATDKEQLHLIDKEIPMPRFDFRLFSLLTDNGKNGDDLFTMSDHTYFGLDAKGLEFVATQTADVAKAVQAAAGKRGDVRITLLGRAASVDGSPIPAGINQKALQVQGVTRHGLADINKALAVAVQKSRRWAEKQPARRKVRRQNNGLHCGRHRVAQRRRGGVRGAGRWPCAVARCQRELIG